MMKTDKGYYRLTCRLLRPDGTTSARKQKFWVERISDNGFTTTARVCDQYGCSDWQAIENGNGGKVRAVVSLSGECAWDEARLNMRYGELEIVPENTIL